MNPLVQLACFPKISHSRFKKLAFYFSDLSRIAEAEFGDFVNAGWEESIADEFVRWRDDNPIDKIYACMEREGVWALTLNEPNYPAMLKQISDPPIALFIRGELPKIQTSAVAVVGTRKFTPYGKSICENIVTALAEQKIMIVSGLALGIDAIAHDTTLKMNGATIAVLGGGVDRPTVGPRANFQLAEQITKSGGAILSEYPPGFVPNKFTFPARNRVIAGLTAGTLVIEAPRGSGALLTAKYALDYNREVMAVPHPINSVTGEGSNDLLKLGARVVTSADDVLETLNLVSFANTPSIKAPENLSEEENKIFNILSETPKHIDIIIDESGLPSATASSTVTLMELKNLIRNVGGMRYTRS
ncbi:MAG: DNA-processing protein DprA [Patescibacteria group bacterium]